MLVSEIIQVLQVTSSRKAKETILFENRDNQELKNTFRLAYDPTISFFIKKIPEYSYSSDEYSLYYVLDSVLPKFYNRELTGNAARAYLANVLSKVTPENAAVVESIIKKDLRVGVTQITANKIWPNLIPVSEVQLAGTDISKIKYPASCQEKKDGLRISMSVIDGKHRIITRNLKSFTDLGHFENEAKRLIGIDETFDGEIVFVDSNENPLPREVSNGLANKAIRGTIAQEEIAGARFYVWDIQNPRMSYEHRLNILRMRFNQNFKTFKMIEDFTVQSEDDVMKIYEKMISEGKEGVVVKNLDALWVSGRTTNLCKIKEVKTADLRVVGWEPGTGKNANRMGNLILESEDGVIHIGVGTGFSDKDRDEITEENSLGRIVEICYNQKSKRDDGGLYLFLPVFKCFRDDKSEANTSDEIQ